MIKKALGKGLDALIIPVVEYEKGIIQLKINEMEPDINQPRKNFGDESLLKLSESIKQYGIVQPVIVKKDGEIFRIVAGERRWRAARIAGLTSIPVIIRDLTNRQVMEVALIENLQREDLNPLEEAEAYEKLIKEYNMTQEDVAGLTGKSRSAVANSIRLLVLNEKIKNYLVTGELSSGHARALLPIENKSLQEKMADEVISKGLNVRDTEKLVKRSFIIKSSKKVEKFDCEISVIEERLKNIFNTKVKLVSNNKKGKILIEYYSNDELERILELVEGIAKK